MAKKTWVAVLLSIIIPGLGLLYIDSSKYVKKFLLCFFLSFLVVPYILGIYWSATAPELKTK